MVFPKNNLPTESQPWTRDVEKRVENLESSFRSAEVNNVTRDSQTLSQIRRLDQAVTDVAQAAADASSAATKAQAAIDGLGSLDEATSTYKINAANITVGSLSGNRISGGTISGVNFETVSGSESLTLSSGRINFFEGGAGIGSMAADTDGSNDYIQIQSNSGIGSLTVGSNYSVLAGSGCAVQPGIVSSGRIDLTATEVFCNSLLTVNEAIVTNQSLVVTNRISSPGTQAATVTASANLFIASNGFIARSTSGRKYKADIQDIDYGMIALELSPKTWVDKARYEENGNSSEGLNRITGFIAEDLHDLGLTELVQYDEDGNPDAINYDRMLVTVIPVIKQQQSMIEALEARIAALESRV